MSALFRYTPRSASDSMEDAGIVQPPPSVTCGTDSRPVPRSRREYGEFQTRVTETEEAVDWRSAPGGPVRVAESKSIRGAGAARARRGNGRRPDDHLCRRD